MLKAVTSIKFVDFNVWSDVVYVRVVVPYLATVFMTAILSEAGIKTSPDGPKIISKMTSADFEPMKSAGAAPRPPLSPLSSRSARAL